MAAAHHAGLGDTSQANAITMQEAAFRAASSAEILAQAVDNSLGALSASVGAFQEAQTSQNAVFAEDISEVDATAGGNSASIQTQEEALASLQGDYDSLAEQVTTVSANAGENTASIQTQEEAVAALQGKTVAFLKETVAASGSTPAQVFAASGDGTSIVQLIAAVLSLSTANGSNVTDVLTLVGSFAYFASKVFIGVDGLHRPVHPGPGHQHRLGGRRARQRLRCEQRPRLLVRPSHGAKLDDQG